MFYQIIHYFNMCWANYYTISHSIENVQAQKACVLIVVISQDQNMEWPSTWSNKLKWDYCVIRQYLLCNGCVMCVPVITVHMLAKPLQMCPGMMLGQSREISIVHQKVGWGEDSIDNSMSQLILMFELITCMQYQALLCRI